MRFIAHLSEDRFGDVVVAAPVRRPLRVSELVHVMAAKRCCETGALAVNIGCHLHRMNFATIEPDLCNLFG